MITTFLPSFSCWTFFVSGVLAALTVHRQIIAITIFICMATPLSITVSKLVSLRAFIYILQNKKTVWSTKYHQKYMIFNNDNDGNDLSRFRNYLLLGSRTTLPLIRMSEQATKCSARQPLHWLRSKHWHPWFPHFQSTYIMW